jgi:hypothetical protein
VGRAVAKGSRRIVCKDQLGKKSFVGLATGWGRFLEMGNRCKVLLQRRLAVLVLYYPKKLLPEEV